MRYHHSITGLALLALLSLPGCTRQEAPRDATTTTAADDAAARMQQQHAQDVDELRKRANDLQQKWTTMEAEVKEDGRTPTAALRAEVKEDVANVRQAVNNLDTTTPDNWWEREEQALENTASDIEADVKRLANGRIPPADATPEPAGTTGYEGRRDAFVARLRARVDALEEALKDVKARGAVETELKDTRARIDKLQDDLDRLRSVSADDWWDVSVKRVREYADRVSESIDRLDNDKRPS